MWEHSLLDTAVASTKSSSDILNAVLPLSVIKDLVEESSWLLVVGIGMLVRISTDNTAECLTVCSPLFVFFRSV